MESSSALSKAAKKNKKKREKKEKAAATSQTQSGASRGPDTAELLEMLKKELEVVKAKQDHKLAGKLREQIWVLTDLERGVRTNIESDELAEILANLNLHKEGDATDSAAAAAEPPAPTKVLTSVASDGQLKKLYKKLEQIEKLKMRQASGDKLETNQLEKIKKEAEVREEIAEMEEIIQDVVTSRS